MTEDPLVPTETLVPLHAQLLSRIDRLDPPLAVNIREGEAGEALARSLLFAHWPDLLVGVENLDPVRLLYNRYFWFVRFKTLWQAAHGYDAGLEGEAFKILENADADLDWNLLEQLNARAQALSPQR